MKILIGVVFSIENEFEECKESLKFQEYTNYEVFYIEGLPNKLAHQKLYSKFMTEKDNFDLFLKLDADMIFVDNYCLNKIVEKFKTTSKLDNLVIGVYDYYTKQNILGMHTFSNRVTWDINSSKIIDVDATIENYASISKIEILDTDIAPIATHGKNPSTFQCFHFGIHKAIKANNGFSIHCINVKYIFELYKSNQSEKRVFMVLGIIYAVKSIFETDLLNFNSNLKIDKFKYFVNKDIDYLKKYIEINYKLIKGLFP